MKPTLVVLAAGMGSRYGGLKQLDSFGPSGETIIDYSVYDALQAGFGKVVFVIREHLLADFQQVYFEKYARKIDIDYVFQELDNIPSDIDVPADRVKPWGTGHALLVARDKVKEPFAVINADDFYGAGSFKLTADHLKELDPTNLDAVLVGFSLAKTLSEYGHVSRGVCEVDEKNQLKGITERTQIGREEDGHIYFRDGDTKHQLQDDQIVSMNLMGFTPPAFDLLEEMFGEFIKSKYQELKAEFYIPQVLDRIATMQQVPVLKSEEKWLGVTYKEDKPLVMEKLSDLTREGKYPTKLW